MRPASHRTLLLGIAAVSAMVLTGCDQTGPSDESNDGASAVAVKVFTVRTRTLRETAKGIGTFQAVETVEIRPEVSGIIEQVNFKEGELIEKGRLLFKIEDTQLQLQKQANQAALEGAKARMTNARWNFDRIKRLRAKNAAAEEEYKQTRDTLREAAAEVERLQAEIRLVEDRIADTEMNAPFEAWISETEVDPGDFVEVGNLLATLYRTSPIELSFSLPERFVGHVHEGDQVRITPAADSARRLTGTVTYVAPAVNQSTRSLPVKATLANDDHLLRPGMFAQAEVVVQTHHDRPVIPEESLVATQEGQAVFIVKNGTAHRRAVEPGLREPGWVEIRKGLEAGQKVVRSGHLRLSDGDAVKVVEQPEDETHTATSPTSTAEHPESSTQPATATAPLQKQGTP